TTACECVVRTGRMSPNLGAGCVPIHPLARPSRVGVAGVVAVAAGWCATQESIALERVTVAWSMPQTNPAERGATPAKTGLAGCRDSQFEVSRFPTMMTSESGNWNLEFGIGNTSS